MTPKPDKLDLPHDKLRKKLKHAGCVFDFIAHSWLSPWTPTEADHRDELRTLFDMIHGKCLLWRDAMMRANPNWRKDHFWEVTSDLTRAAAKPWEGTAAMNLGGSSPNTADRPPYINDFSHFEGLKAAFQNAPHAMRETEEVLFSDFCSAVGLIPGENIEVYDWIGGRELDPADSNWSNYFDEGREWWGICCLTIWNPERFTLAAIAASATD